MPSSSWRSAPATCVCNHSAGPGRGAVHLRTDASPAPKTTNNRGALVTGLFAGPGVWEDRVRDLEDRRERPRPTNRFCRWPMTLGLLGVRWSAALALKGGTQPQPQPEEALSQRTTPSESQNERRLPLGVLTWRCEWESHEVLQSLGRGTWPGKRVVVMMEKGVVSRLCVGR